MKELGETVAFVVIVVLLLSLVSGPESVGGFFGKIIHSFQTEVNR